MVVTMSLIIGLAALALPCWGMLARSRSQHVATSLVMESLERARQTAITTKKDVWVIFQHPAGKAGDSLRLLSKEGNVITPLDRWQTLPVGITFRETEDSLMKEIPPSGLLFSIYNNQPPPAGSHYGSVMFQGSGRVGVPLPGSHPLVLQLNATSVPLPEAITLSRATGRALCQ